MYVARWRTRPTPVVEVRLERGMVWGRRSQNSDQEASSSRARRARRACVLGDLRDLCGGVWKRGVRRPEGRNVDPDVAVASPSSSSPGEGDGAREAMMD